MSPTRERISFRCTHTTERRRDRVAEWEGARHLHKHRTAITSCFMKFVHGNHFGSSLHVAQSDSVGTAFQFPACLYSLSSLSVPRRRQEMLLICYSMLVSATQHSLSLSFCPAQRNFNLPKEMFLRKLNSITKGNRRRCLIL